MALLALRRAGRSKPLLAASAVYASAFLSPAYGERLMRAAALLLPAAVLAALVEARRGVWAGLGLHLSDPLAVGLMRLLGLWHAGLFAYVERATPAQLEAYTAFLRTTPADATVGVRWFPGSGIWTVRNATAPPGRLIAVVNGVGLYGR